MSSTRSGSSSPVVTGSAGCCARAWRPGELRADLDIDVATSCFVAPILYTSLVLCSGSPAPAGLSEKVVDLVLDGAAS